MHVSAAAQASVCELYVPPTIIAWVSKYLSIGEGTSQVQRGAGKG